MIEAATHPLPYADNHHLSDPGHTMKEMNFSAHARERILKVARTFADLAGAQDIRPNDILEAIQYRSLDRKLFSGNEQRRPES